MNDTANRGNAPRVLRICVKAIAGASCFLILAGESELARVALSNAHSTPQTIYADTLATLCAALDRCVQEGPSRVEVFVPENENKIPEG